MLKQLGGSRVENGFKITDYSRDGVNVHTTVKEATQTDEPSEPTAPAGPTLEDKVNYIYYKSMGVIA